MSKLTVGSLFAGIGGFDLGLEHTGGFEVRWQVEIDPYCQRVLAKHWPHVKRYGDIRDCCGNLVRIGKTDTRCSECGRPNWLPYVDVVCGGFPCQDVSEVGGREGIDGIRSGLFAEMLRIIRELRPRFAIVENVSGLFDRGFGRLLGGLAEIGYDAEWSVFSACAFGAPHTRERVFVLAYTDWQRHEASRPKRNGNDETLFLGRVHPKYLHQTSEPISCSHWAEAPSESEVPRVAYGVPARVDRLKGLGNAVVPQIVQWIGERILKAEACQ